jgi:UDP:flavonoid glycosyltransferase YjiC (YdhE family)
VELLAHPRIRLFITHGGYGSLMESALNGVPLVSMGVFADQYRNSRVAERNGWALAFDKKELLLEDGSQRFRDTVARVLNGPRSFRPAEFMQKEESLVSKRMRRESQTSSGPE